MPARKKITKKRKNIGVSRIRVRFTTKTTKKKTMRKENKKPEPYKEQTKEEFGESIHNLGLKLINKIAHDHHCGNCIEEFNKVSDKYKRILFCLSKLIIEAEREKIRLACDWLREEMRSMKNETNQPYYTMAYRDFVSKLKETFKSSHKDLISRGEFDS